MYIYVHLFAIFFDIFLVWPCLVTSFARLVRILKLYKAFYEARQRRTPVDDDWDDIETAKPNKTYTKI